MQTALPIAILYLPLVHAVHGPPFGPVKPTLQVQAVRAKLAIGALELAGHARQVVSTVAPTVAEYVPAPQSVQTALPVAILYFPATHATHGPPLGPVNPTLHVQLVDTVQPLHEAPELAGQAAHATVRPVVLEKVPAVQAVHAALPVVSLYVPAAQVVQMPIDAPVALPTYPALHRHCSPSTQSEYTCTSSNMSQSVVGFTILTYLPDPMQTCVLI